MPTPMPAIFFGHGNPLNALRENSYTRGWAEIGARIPRPAAILSISAHWYVPRTAVTAMPWPRTIHDFGGFPPELYEVTYPVPGDPALASRVQSLLSPITVVADQEWGLDHGTWTVLRHVFPKEDVPVVQLSIDFRQPPAFHFETGRKLAALRDEGVLIMGSGNIVHNLEAYAWGGRHVDPFDWALRAEQQVRELLHADNRDSLVNYEALGPDVQMAAPTPDHYVPLLYVLGLRRKDDRLSFPVEGFDGGSVSMLAVQFG